MRQMPAVFANFSLEERQESPQNVVTESGRGIIDADRGRRGGGAIIDGKVCKQDYDFYECGPHFVAGAAQQIFAESAHVVEEHVVGEPRPNRGGSAQV